MYTLVSEWVNVWNKVRRMDENAYFIWKYTEKMGARIREGERERDRVIPASIRAIQQANAS